MTDVETIKRRLGLEPLPHEGGFFGETYRATRVVPAGELWAGYDGARSIATAIFYLITSEAFSAMHRLPGDEIFHFYMGDPVGMLQLHPDGSFEQRVIGTDLAVGQRPQVLVPAGTWQGSRLVDGGSFALLGATMAPGFDFADYEHGDPAALEAAYPGARDQIRALTREEDG